MAAAPEQRALDAVVDVERQQQIIFDGLAFEHGRLLEFAANSKLGDARFIEPGEVGDAIEQHGAFVRLGLAGDDIHHGRLAGPVRTDDGAHFAGLERQRQVVDGVKAVERDMHAVEIKQRGSGPDIPDVHRPYSAIWGSLTPSSAAALSAFVVKRLAFHGSPHALKVPTMPFGKSSVTRMNIAPSMNSQ